jgi:DNA ligase-associated metallophosphoesterase
MPPIPCQQARIAENVVLDGRLALFHEREKWLAIADLHFGFELSQRVAGRLVPFWGMESSKTRLLQLLADYRPQRLIIVGDLVHDEAAAEPLCELLAHAAEQCEVIAIAGNHDRKLPRVIVLQDSFATGRFKFHHGDCQHDQKDRIEVIGHFHPAASLRDGAGLHLKFPAFVQGPTCWILPAFSPWAAGTPWEADGKSRIWICTPQRVLRIEVDRALPATS